MYEGEERRYNLDSRINEMDKELASFTAKVTEWMTTTTEYRKSLCAKLDALKERPCREANQFKLVWGVLLIVIGATVSAFFKIK